MKFGTQAPDEMGVREALERGCRLFETVFAELEGCTQLEILITWDLNAVFSDIAMEEPIARLKARLTKNAEDVTPAGRAALGGLVKDALERRRAALAGRLSEALRTVAIDTIVHPIVADRIVLHMALLVKTDAVDAVDRCLETLDAEFGGGLSFRCVGPTAPKLRHGRNRIPRSRRDRAGEPHVGGRFDRKSRRCALRVSPFGEEGPSRHGGCPRGRQRSDGGVDESLQVSVAIRARTRVPADRQRAALPRFRCCASCACLVRRQDAASGGAAIVG